MHSRLISKHYAKPFLDLAYRTRAKAELVLSHRQITIAMHAMMNFGELARICKI